MTHFWASRDGRRGKILREDTDRLGVGRLDYVCR
jgi:hypothetical protein